MPQNERYTILIAPDQISSVTSYVDYLYQAGFTLLWASDDAEFFQLAHSDEPDLILLDINGKTQDRLALCQQLQASSSLQYIPIVFVGSGSSDRHAVAALTLGAVDFIRLPITKAELIARVKTHMGTYHRYLQRGSGDESNRAGEPTIPSDRPSPQRKIRHMNLSKREREIAELYAAGYNRGDIASRLEITVNTTHWHLKQIYRKLNVGSKAELIAALR